MLRKIVILILLNVLIFSCGKSKKNFEYAGGKLSLCVESSFLTSEPSEIGDYYSQMIIGQVMESLVSLNPEDLSIRPQLAKKYEVKENGLVYEFTIRDNVYFQDFDDSDEKRHLTPEDVVYSIEKACSKDINQNPRTAFSIVYQNSIKGVIEFYSGKAKSISGLTIKGDKVIIELLEEDNNFLQKLSLTSCSIISKKLDGKDDKIIGTGPFVLRKENINSERLILVKNEDYYLKDKKGNALPYLDTLEFIINSKKLQQLDLFEKGLTDLILGLPTSRISKMLEGRLDDFNSEPPLFVLHNNAQLVANYYYFNMADERFKDILVRKAFNYAIDKDRIGQGILRNQYYELGHYGIVPPIANILRGYDFKTIRENGYAFNPELAKKLLAEAGYPNGVGFGSVNLRFNIDDIHSAVADEFSKQIFQNLNINVNIDGSTFSQLTEDGDFGRGHIFRAGWSADYPSPESFLMNFYGKVVPNSTKDGSYVNQSRYQNSKYDEYISKGKKQSKLAERRKYYSMADAELMKNPPIIPLWYNGEIQIIYSKIRNLHFNAMDLFIFREVYKKDWTKDEFREVMKKK